MMWVIFIIVALMSGSIGALVMAMAVVARRVSDEERLREVYWSGRTDEKRVSRAMLQVDPIGPSVKH
jgi:hypothetical protein